MSLNLYSGAYNRFLLWFITSRSCVGLLIFPGYTISAAVSVCRYLSLFSANFGVITYCFLFAIFKPPVFIWGKYHFLIYPLTDLSVSVFDISNFCSYKPRRNVCLQATSENQRYEPTNELLSRIIWLVIYLQTTLIMHIRSCNVSTADIISERVTSSIILSPYRLLQCGGCDVDNTFLAWFLKSVYRPLLELFWL